MAIQIIYCYAVIHITTKFLCHTSFI